MPSWRSSLCYKEERSKRLPSPWGEATSKANRLFTWIFHLKVREKESRYQALKLKPDRSLMVWSHGRKAEGINSLSWLLSCDDCTEYRWPSLCVWREVLQSQPYSDHCQRGGEFELSDGGGSEEREFQAEGLPLPRLQGWKAMEYETQHTFWSSGGKKYMGGEGEGLRSKDGKGEGQFWRPCQGGVQCFSHDYQDKNLFLEGNICVHVCFLSLNNWMCTTD